MPTARAEATAFPMKRISRRPEGEDVLRDIAILQRTMNRLRGRNLVPKGIYRFSSHEDAEAWMMKQIVVNHVRPSSKI